MLRSGFLVLICLMFQASYAQSLQGPSSEMLPEQMEQASTMKEPTDSLVDGSDSLVIEELQSLAQFQISKELAIDCVWITQHPYFNQWTSDKINPYDLDGAKYTDTLTVQFEDSLSSYALPISNTYVTSPFGFRRYRWHYGTDLKLYKGDSVGAAFDGVVRIVDYERYGYGHYVVLRHLNGLETLYGHLSKTSVKIGDRLKAGQLVGLGGSTGRSTGTHLHFEVRYQGNAIDPSTVYDFSGDCLLATSHTITPASFEYLKEARKRRFHRIRRGDTLGHISRRYGISINRICRLNGISRRTILRIGRRLRIS